MPRRKFIDKKNAATFSLVYRAQNDPLIHDSEASDMVFTEVAAPNTNKIKRRQDLEVEFGGAVRNNEGEAANYGIYYDDTEYDYMQHLRDLGTANEGYFVESRSSKKDKGKGKQKLEDALREISLDDGRSSAASSVQSSVTSELLGDEMLPSEFVRPANYQDQQDVPDVIAGFQPDMDPRLREALEALEDEAYVDDEDDVFAELAKDAQVVDPDDWEASAWAEEQDDEGWETDDTIKADTNGGTRAERKLSDADAPDSLDGGPVEPTTNDHGDGDWMAEFSKFKKDVKSAQQTNKPDAARTPSEFQSIITGSSALTSGRRKKRKGARTSTSGYSMSSSILARTDAQSLLDQRFDKIEEEYADDDADYEYDESMSMASGMTGLSRISGLSKMSGVSTASEKPPQLVMAGLEGVMDDFLGSYSTTGKRNRVKKGGPQTGLEQLDEIRQALGPARIKPQWV